jgi:2-polyprenyl-3-methyl-5-hydroxy-6-metoxy-1,4-benzoquinol methylase
MTRASEARLGGMPLAEVCQEVFRLKAPDSGKLGWSPKLRSQFGYYTPDEWYEATLFSLIDEQTDWLDVGCGHRVFPSNPRLADVLASRCRSLTGVDPDDSITTNRWLHQYKQCRLEDFDTDRRFDLISLRMVAEHIANPVAAAATLSRLARDGGRVVIYTVSKWAPASLVAAATPIAVHHMVKGFLWGSSPEDTFPTVYRMNTRKRLDELFGSQGFVEENFLYLNDCRAFSGWRFGAIVEMSCERVLRRIGIPYPEVCLLGVYRKNG